MRPQKQQADNAEAVGAPRPQFLGYRQISFALVLLAGLVGIFILSRQGIDWRGYLEAVPREVRFLFWPAMAVLPLFGFPITAFYLGLALLFPTWMALTLGPLFLGINMGLGYWLGHSVWKGFTLKMIRRYFPGFEGLSELNAFRSVVLIRAIPGTPYVLQNYVFGALGVPFYIYIFCSVLIQSGYLAGFVLTVNGVLNEQPIIAVFGLLFIGIGILLTHRLLKHNLSETEKALIQGDRS